MLRSLAGFGKGLPEAIEPLWVSGLALIQLILVHRYLPLSGERYEWAQYLLCGTLYPLLVLILSWPQRTAPRWIAPRGLLRMLLALGCPVLAGVCLFRDFRALFLLLGLVAPFALRA
jgi:hypothetical protein